MQVKEELYYKDILRIKTILNALNPREQKIFILKFGLSDGKFHSLKEISKELGITRERVRQILGKIMSKVDALYSIYEWK